MVTIRSLLYYLALSVDTMLFSLVLVIPGAALAFRTRSVIANAWGIANLKLLSRICGLDYRIQGLEHLSASGNCIVMSKHQSAWETIALRGILPPEQTWVLKRELTWIPFFGWGLSMAEPIAIDRKAGRKAVRQLLGQGKTCLETGRWVIIFPEGTRVAPGERKKYEIGGALLASKTGYPVIPIAHNAGVFWKRRGINKYPGTIQVVIGKPIDTRGLSAPEINRQIEGWIEEQAANLPFRRSD